MRENGVGVSRFHIRGHLKTIKIPGMLSFDTIYLDFN